MALLEREVVAPQGAPDLLVNNAGAGRWLFTDETSPEEAAAALVGGVLRDAREVVVPFMLRLIQILERPFPGLTRWLLRATGVKHPRARD